MVAALTLCVVSCTFCVYGQKEKNQSPQSLWDAVMWDDVLDYIDVGVSAARIQSRVIGFSKSEDGVRE